MKAYQLSQNDVYRFHVCRGLAFAHYFMDHTEAALSRADKVENSLPAHAQHLSIKAAILVRLGRLEDARDYLDRYLTEVPHMTVEKLRRRLYWRNQDYVGRFLEDLAKTGLPQ